MKGRRILLGVTGGIAAYKAAELARLLVKAEAETRVVMTSGAQAFVAPLTFQALTGHPVRTDLLDPQAEAAMGHIELARWADQILIAPATADFIARLVGGRADDLLTTTCLASDAPIAVAPAMNAQMWAKAATQRNCETLRERGVQIIGPAAGEQACGETGLGRLEEPADILRSLSAGKALLAGRKVVITAGPTYEDLDPVRFLGNRSSGKMGYALARAAVEVGANVTLVSGPVALATPSGVTRVDVRSAQDMYDVVLGDIGTCDLFIGAAAVADYRPAAAQPEKIKKRGGDGTLTIELVENPDILKAVVGSDCEAFAVGFAAETAKVMDHARSKLHHKGAAMIIANHVGKDRAFDQNDNAVTVLWRDGERVFPRQDKLELARKLVELIAQQMASESGPTVAALHAQHRSQTA